MPLRHAQRCARTLHIPLCYSQVLDVDALVWLQNQAQSLAVTAFLMLTARNFLVAKGCPPDLDFMDRLVSRFSVLLDSPTTLDFIIAEAW